MVRYNSELQIRGDNIDLRPTTLRSYVKKNFKNLIFAPMITDTKRIMLLKTA